MAGELVARVEMDVGAHPGATGDRSGDVALSRSGATGDRRGGLELLLLSLAACTGQTALPILRKMRIPVTGLTIVARGTPRDRHPAILTSIHLELTVRGRELDPADVRRGVELAEGYCPVWAMLSPTTPITTTVVTVEG